MKKLFKGTGYAWYLLRHFDKGDNSVTSCLLSCLPGPYEKVPTPEGINLLSRGANSFLE